MNSAASTNGNASPSLSPASDVSAKFGSCSSSSPGGPTPMSPASTGSVGAMQAPSSSAAPAESPSSCEPSSAISPIVIGIAISSSRAVVPQARRVSSRSSFSPALNSAMITAISVRWSSSVAFSTGSTQSIPARLITTAAAAPRPR